MKFRSDDPHHQACKKGYHVWNHWTGQDHQCVVCNSYHPKGPDGICEEKGHWWEEDVTDPFHPIPVVEGGVRRCTRCSTSVGLPMPAQGARPDPGWD